MKLKSLILTPLFLLWLTGAVHAGELVFSQFRDNRSTYGPSQTWSVTGTNSEVADDFVVTENGKPMDLSGVTFYSNRRLLEASPVLARQGASVDQVPEWPQPTEGGGCYRVDGGLL